MNSTTTPMRSCRVFSLILASFLAGCVVTDVTILTPNNRPYPAVPVDTVRVFLDASEIPAPYEKVALVHAHGDAGLTNPAQMIEAARKKAASLGANGILVSPMREPSSGESLGAKWVSPLLSGDRKGSLLAVRYSERPAKTAAVAASPPSSPLWDGFRDMRWGDPPTATMASRGTNSENGGALYYRADDYLFVGIVPLTDIFYEFWDGRLRAVALEAQPYVESALIAELIRAWGPPSTDDKRFVNWVRPGDTTGAMLGKGAAEKNWSTSHVMIFDQKFFDTDRRVNKAP